MAQNLFVKVQSYELGDTKGVGWPVTGEITTKSAKYGVTEG